MAICFHGNEPDKELPKNPTSLDVAELLLSDRRVLIDRRVIQIPVKTDRRKTNRRKEAK